MKFVAESRTEEMAPKKYDVIVIGGGVLGASVAYHCAKDGLTVLVLEKNEPLCLTSGATYAWLGSHLKMPASYNRLNRDGIAMYAGLEKELESDLEYSEIGSIFLMRTEREFEEARQRITELNAEGFPLELLDGKAVLRREPLLPALYSGGYLCPIDIEVNPFKTVAAYLRKARELGAELRFQTEVTSLGSGGGDTRTVVAGERSFETRHVVSATGIFTPAIAAMVGAEVPMVQSRGQILVTEKSEKRLNGFVACLGDPGRGGFMLKQVSSGNFLFGYTQEPVSFDDSVTYDGFTSIARTLADSVPALRSLAILRSYGGIRPIPSDALPIISEAPGQPGLILLVMHSGFTLSVLVGRAVAARLAGREDSPLFTEFSLERFAGQQPAAGTASAFGGSG